MRSRPQREHHVAHATAATRPSNHMLKAISRSDFALLAGELEFVELPLRLHLEEANRPIKHVYFPEAGIASIVANGGHDREIEVGIIGREGMTGLNVVMGNDRSPHSTFIQMEGRGARISADRLRAAMDKSESLRLCFLHFVQAFAVQAAHTALANGRGTVEERLARWMLMAHDRIEGDELAFTHEFLALMLGVRRPGVSVAVQYLASKGLLQSSRGSIVISDREGLKQMANGLYGTPEAEYRRLTGWKPPHDS